MSDIDSLPPGTRLILASEDLLSFFGTRTEEGDRLTAEWGEPKPGGWYEPIFTVRTDDNPLRAAEAREKALLEAGMAVLRAADAFRDALNGRGHEGEPHDRFLAGGPINGIEVRDAVGDCAACGGAQYGAEYDLQTAYGDLREALGLTRLPWEVR